MPSIDMILKLTKVFNVSVDYIVGEGKYVSYDKVTTKRLESIENLAPETRQTLFQVIDTFLRDSKTVQAYS